MCLFSLENVVKLWCASSVYLSELLDAGSGVWGLVPENPVS